MQPSAPFRPPHERERLHREAEARWRRLGAAYPELAATIAHGRGLVALYIDDLPPPATLDLDADRARRKLAAGVPLLIDEVFATDPAALRHFFYRLCLWAGRQPELAAEGRLLERALLDGQLRAEELFAAALADDQATIGAVARRLDLPEVLLHSLTGYLLVAALLGTARALGPLLDAAEPAWAGDGCPVCSGPPLLAELLDERPGRWLRCAACGTGWAAPDDRCIHCGTTDATMRETVSLGGPDRPNRLETCRRCRGYLKLATVPSPTPPELLTIVDTAFVGLEAAARDQGFTATPAG